MYILTGVLFSTRHNYILAMAFGMAVDHTDLCPTENSEVTVCPTREKQENFPTVDHKQEDISE